MKFINKYFAVVLLSTTSVFSFEVNTHQAITRCTVTTECGQAGVLNLDYFIFSALLDLEDYKEKPVAKFGQYGRSYFDYGEKGETVFLDYQIQFQSGSTIFDLIEAGVVLEDAIYHNAIPVPKLKAGDGRFNNHFYMAQTDIPFSYSLIPGVNPQNILRHTERTLYADLPVEAFGPRTDNITWALLKDISVGPERINNYTIHKAFEYYKKSFNGKATDRKENQAHLFASMGFLIHLLQDLHSPAHVRNGSHPGGDYLEIYGRYNGGFHLRNGQWKDAVNDPSIVSAMATIDTNKVMLIDNHYSSYQDFFAGEALWASENFFSEAHDFDFFEAAANRTSGEGIELNDDTCRDKNTTIFDSRNDNLSLSQTGTRPIPDAETWFNGSYDKWFYITNPLANTSITGLDAVALKEEGWFTDCESMAAVTDGLSSNKSYANYNKEALSSTATNVMPRAMASSQAFINYFFRGRMEAYINYEDANSAKILDTITIKNISEPLLVSSEELLTFKEGATLTISYIKEDDEDKEIIPLTIVDLPVDLLVGEEFEIKNLKQLFTTAGVNTSNGDKVLVLLDGQIGEEPAGSLDDYNINAQGLAVAYATEPTVLIKKTGQNYAYTPFDDGHYKKGVNPAYTRAPSLDYVYDGISQLLWHNPTEIIERTFPEASAYCEDLIHLNVQWRLPNVRELLTLNDVRLIPDPVFKNTIKYGTYRSNRADKTVEYNHPNIAISGVGTGDTTNQEIATRCVVGEEIADSTLSRNDETGIVRDRSTGLIWQDDINYLTNLPYKTWEENIDYCESLNLGGYSDWRMANVNELYSIVDSDGVSEFQNNNYPSFFSVSSTASSDNTRYDVGNEGNTIKWAIIPIAHPGQPGFQPDKGYTRCVR